MIVWLVFYENCVYSGFVVIDVCDGVLVMVMVMEFWWWHRSDFGSVGDGLHDCSMAGLKFGGGFQWLRLEFGGEFQWWHRSEFGGGIHSQIGVWWWVSFSDRRGMAPRLAKFLFLIRFGWVVCSNGFVWVVDGFIVLDLWWIVDGFVTDSIGFVVVI